MRVLVATDGSTPAGVGIELVASLRWPSATTIHVVEAVEDATRIVSGVWPAVALVDPKEIEEDARGQAERTVSDAAARLAGVGVTVECSVLRGRASTAIIAESRRTGADLIVIGSRGHGEIESMLLGSVSAEILDHSTVPVLVARTPKAERVVVAWDGSSCARAASTVLMSWPMFDRSCVRVVSVGEAELPWWTGMPATGSPELLASYAQTTHASRALHEELARDLARELQTAARPADAECRTGSAASEIIAAANSWGAELIVMGTHGRTGLARLVMGSVARNVLHHATCSVLVVRDPATEAPRRRSDA